MPVTSRIAAAAARGFGLFSAIAKVTDAYFKYVTLLLPGNGTNGAQNNTFLDSSSNAFTITRNGNTTQGNFSPFSQTGWGNYFNGSTDYLSGIGSVSSFNFMHNTTALFTAECWVYINSLASIMTLFDNNNSTTAQTGVTAQIYTNGTINLLITYGSTGNNIANVTTTGTVTTNQWTHIAFVYDQSVASNNAQIYINGTLAGSGNKTANTPSSGNASNALRIGCYGAGTGQFMNGYISNFRISNSKVYTANFTPSTTALTTSSQGATSVALLTCQSNRFVDNSSNAFAITANGTPSVQAFSPFAPTAAWSATTNGGSGYFDGSGDYLSAPDNAAWYFTGDFTVECWAYWTSTASAEANVLAQHRPADASNQAIEFWSNSTTLYLAYSSSSVTTTISANQWYHLAMSCTSGTASCYVNGTRIGTFAMPTRINSADPFTVGARTGSGGTGGTGYFTGYVTDVRVLNGTGLYSGTTISVPTVPLTAITNTQLLLSATNGGIVDATAKNDLETVGNAQISTTQSKFGGSSIKATVAGDYVTPPYSQYINFGTGDFTIECWFYLNAISSSYYAVGGTWSSATSDEWLIQIQNNGTIRFLTTADTAFYGSGITSGTWYHFAASRASGSLKVFLNGTSIATIANSNSIGSVSKTLQLGQQPGGVWPLNGYIDDFRITKGIARYTSNFTPPTTAFPVQ